MGSQGVIYVIDATDNKNLEVAIQELERVLSDPQIDESIPIAIFMNKVS